MRSCAVSLLPSVTWHAFGGTEVEWRATGHQIQKPCMLMREYLARARYVQGTFVSTLFLSAFFSLSFPLPVFVFCFLSLLVSLFLCLSLIFSLFFCGHKGFLRITRQRDAMAKDLGGCFFKVALGHTVRPMNRRTCQKPWQAQDAAGVPPRLCKTIHLADGMGHLLQAVPTRWHTPCAALGIGDNATGR